MKYYCMPTAQLPIMSDDMKTVIGFTLTVKMLSGDHVVEREDRYEMEEEHWFPVAEMNQRVTEATLRGHNQLGTFAQAEAEMDALVAGDE